MNQNFTPTELTKFLAKQDLIEHSMTKSELLTQLEDACERVNSGTFEFSIKKNGLIYSAQHLVDKLILRKLNDIIKRIYKDEQSNRRVIIKQLITLLPEQCSFWVLKTDISKFYETINRDRIYSKLFNDAKLTYSSMYLVGKIFSNRLVANETGLPRGIGISSTLSEIYMRRFDRFIKRYEGVYFYSRFVDDIVIFCNKKESLLKLKDALDANLEIGLVHNPSKTEVYDGSEISANRPLEYLGYKFYVTQAKGAQKELKISIADKKIKKIKTRLVRSFTSFLKDTDFDLLEKRIRFLCTNYSVKSSTSSSQDLKAGIYYNYHHINDLSALRHLNGFYHKLVNARTTSFGAKLTARLSPENKARLRKYSFKNGFQNKVYSKFSYSDMKVIKKCWLHE